MNRRKFLKMLGIIPLAPFVIKGLNIPKQEKDEYHPYFLAKDWKQATWQEPIQEEDIPDKSDKDAWLL